MVRNYLEKLLEAGEPDNDEELTALVEEAKATLGIHLDYHYVGEFDSPGFTANFYVITWIAYGKVEVLPVEIIWC